MIAKNLTSEVKGIKLRSIPDGTDYDIYLQPHGTTHLERVIILNKKQLEGLVDFGEDKAPVIDTTNPVVVNIESQEEPITEEKVEEELEDTTDEEQEESAPEVLPDAFICDVCGSEFSSSRSLASHKTRAHSN